MWIQYVCLFQETRETKRPGELTKMLLQADDKKVYKFLDALVENGQSHVADILRVTGNFFYLGNSDHVTSGFYW